MKTTSNPVRASLAVFAFVSLATLSASLTTSARADGSGGGTGGKARQEQTKPTVSIPVRPR